MLGKHTHHGQHFIIDLNLQSKKIRLNLSNFNINLILFVTFIPSKPSSHMKMVVTFLNEDHKIPSIMKI